MFLLAAVFGIGFYALAGGLITHHGALAATGAAIMALCALCALATLRREGRPKRCSVGRRRAPAP